MSASTHLRIVGTEAVFDQAVPAPAASRRQPLVFDAVYREHFAFVWRAAKRLGVGDGALDDVVQEVFVVVHRRLDGFEGRSSLKTWLFGIALRIVRDHRRAVRRRPKLLPELTMVLRFPASAEGPERVVFRHLS